MKPDKYPDCPPGENPFTWILRTAEKLRRQQSHLADLERSRLHAKARAEMKARAALADEEIEKRGPKPDRYWQTQD